VSAPVRTCVGCRSKRPKSALVRVVAEAGREGAHEEQRLSGRPHDAEPADAGGGADGERRKSGRVHGAGEAPAVVPDVGGDAPGRGAYICPSLPCVEQAVRRGGLGRSFKRPLRLGDFRDLARQIASGLRSRARAEAGRRAPKSESEAIDLGPPWGVVFGEERAWRIVAGLSLADALDAEAAAAVRDSARKSEQKSGRTPPA
jgi:uncharacterized protein